LSQVPSVEPVDKQMDRSERNCWALLAVAVVLQHDAMIPEIGSGRGLAYDHQTVHGRPELKRMQVFSEDEMCVQGGPPE
jgi:hypothetical protein